MNNLVILVIVTVLVTATFANADFNGFSQSDPASGSTQRHTVPTRANCQPVAPQTTSNSSPVQEDPRTLAELYAAALAEGGTLIVYAGGDSIGSQDGTKAEFEAQFPGMTLDIIVDLSKFHDGRIDNQLATHTLIPDLTQLQTVPNFPRWAHEGVLLNYKPIGWQHIYPKVKDFDGAFTGLFFVTFGTVVNTQLSPNQADWPRQATDLLRPSLTGKMIGTYPNDDDAVLFWYKLIVDKYGWDYMRQLAGQNITFVRGTSASRSSVALGQHFFVGIGTSGPAVAYPGLDLLLLLETDDDDPFMSWAQTAAIFKNATHPEAAKLYLSWVLTTAFQAGGFSVRDDVPSPTGKTIWEYTNTNPLHFARFMSDRAGVESFRTQITLYFGEVQGESPTGHLGTHPSKALPH